MENEYLKLEQARSFTVLEFLVAVFLDFLALIMAVFLALVAYDSLVGGGHFMLAIPPYVWNLIAILIIVMIIMAITWTFAMIFTFKDLRKHKS